MKGDSIVERNIVLEMGHRLVGHNGKCKGLHGHSWSLTVGVTGPINSERDACSEGMVMDFGDLKAILQEIEKYFDHAMTLCANDPFLYLLKETNRVTTWWGRHIETEYGPINIVPFPPTSENLAVLWGSWVSGLLPEGIKLAGVEVKETANSKATWIPA